MLASYSSTTPNLQIGLSEIENARGRQCRQAMRTRLCGGIPADLTFCYFLVKQKVEKKNITNRGFTGHEHYNFFKIINMNGRLYDPVIARFFSPDKYVANSSFTQDFNRYTYARNNPLHYTDPSGDFLLFAILAGAMYAMYQAININGGFDAGKVIGGGIIGAAAGGLGAVVGTGAGFGFTGGLFGGLTSGFASGLTSGTWNSWMQGGSFLDGLGDGIRAGFIAGGIGGLMGGITGGIYAKRHGGNFWDGNGMRAFSYAPRPAPENNIVEIGEGMEFTTEYANNFRRENFVDGVVGVDEITARHSPPGGHGLTQDGDFIYKGKEVVNGLAVYNAETRYSNIYLFKSAFVSREQLYLTMGHELLHAGLWYTGKFGNHHGSIHTWQYEQAKVWNYNTDYYYKLYKGASIPAGFHYDQFKFATIRLIRPW